jgi:hypothetical protein
MHRGEQSLVPHEPARFSIKATRSLRDGAAAGEVLSTTFAEYFHPSRVRFPVPRALFAYGLKNVSASPG